MLTKPKTSGPGTVVRFKRRQQKRNRRRPLEAVEQDWEMWDAAAERMGINWSEFCRRAQNALAASLGPELTLDVVRRRHTVSEKGGVKNGAAKRTKVAGTRAARKG
jgi:hypothetical protein